MGFMIIYGKPLKELFNFWPKWLWIANGLLIAVSLLIIFCTWARILAVIQYVERAKYF